MVHRKGRTADRGGGGGGLGRGGGGEGAGGCCCTGGGTAVTFIGGGGFALGGGATSPLTGGGGTVFTVMGGGLLATGGGMLGGEGARTMTGGGGFPVVSVGGGGFLATVSGGGLPATVIGGEGARMTTGACTGGGGDWARPAGKEKADEGTSASGEPTVDDFSSNAVPPVTCERRKRQHKLYEGPRKMPGRRRLARHLTGHALGTLGHTKTCRKTTCALLRRAPCGNDKVSQVQSQWQPRRPGCSQS